MLFLFPLVDSSLWTGFLVRRQLVMWMTVLASVGAKLSASLAAIGRVLASEENPGQKAEGAMGGSLGTLGSHTALRTRRGSPRSDEDTEYG
jgi:hypothetical protein